MKFQIFSDLHLEMKPDTYPIIPRLANIIILAGDIGRLSMSNYRSFIKYCSETWDKVFYVFGNHEFYSNRSFTTIIEKYKEFFMTFNNVHLLDNSYVEYDGYIFYGFTGWTMPIFTTSKSAKEVLNDYNYIRTTEGRFSISYQSHLSNHQTRMFKNFIESLNDDEDNIIVITHFSPLKHETLNPKRLHPELDDYYCWNDILHELHIDSNKIKAWCAGHTHWSYKFKHNDVLYVSNAIGYENVSISNAGLITL